LFAALQMNASDRSLMNAFRDISAMADKLNLPRSIVVRYTVCLCEGVQMCVGGGG